MLNEPQSNIGTHSLNLSFMGGSATGTTTGDNRCHQHRVAFLDAIRPSAIVVKIAPRESARDGDSIAPMMVKSLCSAAAQHSRKQHTKHACCTVLQARKAASVRHAAVRVIAMHYGESPCEISAAPEAVSRALQ
jgi:hypothetical protein